MDNFYSDTRFYEQWWALIDLGLLTLITIGAALASYRRESLRWIRVIGFVLCSVTVGLTVYGIVIACYLPFQTIHHYSKEVLATARNLPPAPVTTNYMNYIALVLSFLILYPGWKLAKTAWFLRQNSSTYQVETINLHS